MRKDTIGKGGVPKAVVYKRRVVDIEAYDEVQALRKQINEMLTLPQVRAAVFTKRLAELYELGKTTHLYEVYVIADHARPNEHGLYPAWWTRTPDPNKFVIVESKAREGHAFNAQQIEDWITKLETK